MSTISSISTRTAHKPFVQKHALLTFFLLAFGLTWVLMIADALGSHGLIPFRLNIALMILMGYMPTLAALTVTAATQGKAGVRTLLGKLLIVRVGWQWYAFAIFGFAGICAGAVELANWIGGAGAAVPLFSTKLPHFSGPLQAVFYLLPMFVVIGLVNGEELAWRGFALPRLQAKFSALTSSLILGAIWTAFHLPLFFTLTGSSQATEPFLSFAIATISLTVLYTWLLNHTRGSVLLAYLFHAAQNTWSGVFSVDHGNAAITWSMTGLILLCAVIVVLTTGAENLSRSTSRIQE